MFKRSGFFKGMLISFIFMSIIFAPTSVLSKNSNLLDDLLKSSEKLQSISCTIHMNDMVKKSEVGFKFFYKRQGGKMRIEYIYPKGMKGSKIAVDGKYFYMYLSAFKRTMKKEIGKEKKRMPGSEMGIFFHYVVGDLDKISSYGVRFVGEESLKMDWKGMKYESSVYHVILENGNEREEAWLDRESFIPVKIMIYLNGKPKLEVEVFNVELNKRISDDFFRLD